MFLIFYSLTLPPRFHIAVSLFFHFFTGIWQQSTLLGVGIANDFRREISIFSVLLAGSRRWGFILLHRWTGFHFPAIYFLYFANWLSCRKKNERSSNISCHKNVRKLGSGYWVIVRSHSVTIEFNLEHSQLFLFQKIRNWKSIKEYFCILGLFRLFSKQCTFFGFA